MDDLVQFVRARLDEDEVAARAASSDLGNVTAQVEYLDAATQADERHIARHEPPRVLADIEAKRQILDGIAGADPEGAYITANFTTQDVLRLLGLPFANHPAYREEWRP